MTYPVFLPAIVIDSTNKAIRMTENGVTQTLNLVEGTYFLRGDGGADDFLAALVTAMNTHTGGTNTYSATVTWSCDGAAATAVISYQRATGSNSFGILWADALTTVDEALIGFSGSDTVNTSAKTSTLSPTAAWVSSDVYEEFEPEDELDAYAVRARSGVVRGGVRGGPFDVRRLSMRFISEGRTHHSRITSDVARAFSKMWAKLAQSRRFELHFGTLSSGTTLNALSTSTRQGTAWHLSDDTVEGGFVPERLGPGVPLYSWRLRLWGYVA